MGQKTYWKGVEQIEGLDVTRKQENHDVKLSDTLTDDKVAETKSSRRDFLKVLGFSVTAASIAASCEMPVRKAIPYVVKPEEVLPGTATWYASTFYNGGDYANVLVKTTTGRPIKIEPNDHPDAIASKGTTARVQASVLSLYDNHRLHHPMMNGNKASWGDIDKAVIAALEANPAQKIAIVSSSILSPSTRSVIADFKAKYSGTEHIVYDGVSQSGVLDANEASLGKRMFPAYNFDKAEVIVGIGCDFLGNWGYVQRNQEQYGAGRKVSKDKPKMSRHYQFEARMSLTGANADYRYSVKPSSEAKVVKALYNELSGSGSPAIDEKFCNADTIKQVASDLRATGGKGLVVSGSNDRNVQILVNKINDIIGSYGSTIDAGTNVYVRQGNDKAFMDFVGSMSSYGTIIVWDCNPGHNMPNASAFTKGLKACKNSISFNDRVDETSVNCNYICPDNHYLESWNDAMVMDGHYGITQPTIAPLFDTRQGAETLLKWSGSDKTYYDYIKDRWMASFGLDQNGWDKIIQAGVYKSNREPGSAVAVSDAAVSTALASWPSAPTGDYEVMVFEHSAIGDGRYANNPWLQELPDGVSKACWENFAAMSPQEMQDKGIKQGDRMTISVEGGKLDLPILSQPGQLSGTISIALGYGRKGFAQPGSTNNLKCADGLGVNAAVLSSYNGNNVIYNTAISGASITPGKDDIAQTQMHHTVDGMMMEIDGEYKLDKRLTSNYSFTGYGDRKRTLVKETTLKEYKENPYSGNEDRAHIREHHQTLYPEYDYNGHHWAMSVDLNSCIGCGACVVACNSENNIPVVGKKEVNRAHEMHWMNIDRYYAGDIENPSVVFQPLMCQHCDNAPCENVCPVAATNHSSEGINQMAYNRCIGTRYCANNCPYKVRRFNWFDYTGADSFVKGTIFGNDKGVAHMLEDLTRMVLNPDVTVRSRGVMEKCTFCVQRIQDGKLNAKKEMRALRDGEIKTACQTSCVTGAIVFGDINDPDSEVHKIANPDVGDERGFQVLEELHVLPSITYLTKVRNVEPETAKAETAGH